MSAEDTVLVTTEDAVARVVLNAPERRNAVSYAMREHLADAFAGLDEDPAVRVAILTGAGSAFCSGVDLTDGGAPAGHALGQATKPLTWPLERFSKPLLAAVNGPAVGGGCELALAADLRIASTSAWFALTEVTIGSLPGSGGTQRLARSLPPAVAAKLLFTGERLNAGDAFRYGLVSDIAAPGDLLSVADALAGRVAKGAPLSLRAAKLALRAAVEQPLADGLTLERTLWGMLSTTHDREEGRAAFRERRPPRFTGE